MRKWDALRLVRELRGELGLSRSACEALEKMAAMTAEADWTDPGRLPLCYRRQVDMADELGITPRQFRTIEHRLEAAGLIERRVTANGWRGRAGGSDTAPGISGLSLAPLIGRVPGLMQLVARIEAERQEVAALRIEVRVAWRRLGRRLETAPSELRDEAAALAPPRSETLHRMAPAALRGLLARFEAVVDRLSAGASDTPKTSGAPETEFRCHTEDTTESEMNFCSAEAHEQTAGTPADARFVSETDGSEHCPREQAASGRAHVTPDPVAGVGLPLLRRIASAELHFYLEGLACGHLEDAERAIVFRLQELGIDRTAYEAAQEVMGWQAALLAVAIIDRNRDHPVTPIRNPGGALRALTWRHQQGALDLMASVLGILGREGDSSPLRASPGGRSWSDRPRRHRSVQWR